MLFRSWVTLPSPMIARYQAAYMGAKLARSYPVFHPYHYHLKFSTLGVADTTYVGACASIMSQKHAVACDRPVRSHMVAYSPFTCVAAACKVPPLCRRDRPVRSHMVAYGSFPVPRPACGVTSAPVRPHMVAYGSFTWLTRMTV